MQKKNSKVGRKSMPILALAEIEENLQGKKNRDVEKNLAGSSAIGENSPGTVAAAAAAAEKEEEDRDLRYINKIRKNVHLMYESGNLDTPMNKGNNNNKKVNQPDSEESSPVGAIALKFQGETESVDFAGEILSVESQRIHEGN